jgi:MFS family permease
MSAPATRSAIDPATARATRSARVAVGGLFFICGVAFACWASRIPQVQAALALSPGTLGAAIAGLGAGSFVAMPLSGWLTIRFGSRPIASSAAIACTASLILPALAWDAVSLGGALVVFGAAIGVLDVAMNAQAVELEHRIGRPIMSGLHALFSAGGMSGAAIGGVIASWQVPVAMHLAGAAVVLAVTAVLLRPALIETPPPPPGEPGSRLRLSRVLVGLSVLGACVMIGEGAMADWTPVYLASVIGTGPGLAASGYAVFSATMMLGRLAGDRLTERIGRVRLVRLGTLLAAGGLAVALLLGTLPAALVGFACVGAGFSVAVPLVFSAAGRLDSRSAGPGLAAVTTAGYLGFLAGPPVIGVVAQTFTLPVALALVAVLALVGTALAGFVAVLREPAPLRARLEHPEQQP